MSRALDPESRSDWSKPRVGLGYWPNISRSSTLYRGTTGATRGLRAAGKGFDPWDSSTLRTSVPGVAPFATEAEGGRDTEVARPVLKYVHQCKYLVYG